MFFKDFPHNHSKALPVMIIAKSKFCGDRKYFGHQIVFLSIHKMLNIDTLH